MRILKRKEFLKLEGQHLFSKVNKDGYCSETIAVKSGNCGENDFCVDYLDSDCAIECNCSSDHSDKIEMMVKDSSLDFPMDFYFTGRDGSYEGDDILFAVYSKRDVEQLIERLGKCLK